MGTLDSQLSIKIEAISQLTAKISTISSYQLIGHFTVVCLVTWHWFESEAGGDLVLIQTSLLFTCRSCHSYVN